ncbi:site-specific DNA-methyltransferase [Candidatus Woesearchaeota archaeon]|nr:site-specific DNA-methyltransferase [Candidatus Woesearchaeota archaeon]
MQNTFQKLEKIFKKDERLISDDGKLLKNKAVELAHKLDEDLIKVLAGDKDLKKIFFKKVSDITVFDKDLFIEFVSNKEFLPDSYTAFKNKIGFFTNGEYLKQNKDVVLVWPYKDCVLEGGQTKEDAKRKEIFWNTTLAPDEISRLLEPKVLTNWKRYDKENTKTGHKTKDIKDTDNLVIKGNNLLTLHSLEKHFAGKVKLIYIDPPYNTGNDEFKYNDSFNHSSWLTFMQNRLEIARNLLTEDGFIVVQCDHNEQAYLRVLMDSVFNRDNFINSIIWKRTFSHGDVGQGAQHLGRLHDTLLLYSKSKSYKLNTVYTPYSEKYINDFYKYNDKGGRYRLVSLLGPGGASKGNPYYEFLGVKKYWVYSEKKMNELYKEGKIVQSKKGIVPQKKRYLDEAPGVPLQDLWLDINPLQGSSKEKYEFTGQKPEQLLARILELTTNRGDIVIDYHAGTGTTGATAHKMGRQYILAEQMDYIHDLPEARLKKVIDGEQGGISKDVKWKGGGSFVYAELMPLNEKYVREIRDAKTKKDIEKIWKEIQKSGFLSYKIDPKKFNKEIKSFVDLDLENQKKFILESLDENMLYVNYSDVNNKDYKVSKEDKDLNKGFYNK